MYLILVSKEFFFTLERSRNNSEAVEENSFSKQECIPVGCVPSAAVAVSPGGTCPGGVPGPRGGGGTCLGGVPGPGGTCPGGCT